MKDGIFLSREVLKQALQFAEKNAGCRTALNGIWVNVSDKSKPIIETTDGHRLHRIATDDSATSPDSCHLIKTEIEKKSPYAYLNANEVRDVIFKLTEIVAIMKVQPSAARGEAMRIKFTKHSILFMAYGNIIVRYIKPEGSIPKKLVGMAVGANVKYALDALETMEGHAIELSVDDALSPIIIKPSGKDYPLHLLMPMRLEGQRVR